MAKRSSDLRPRILGWLVLSIMLFGTGFAVSFTLTAPTAASIGGEADTADRHKPAERLLLIDVVNRTGGAAEAGIAGYADSWTAVGGRSELKLRTTASAVTIKLRTDEGGQCFVFTSGSGTVTAIGDPATPSCLFAAVDG
ncbi:MAG: hypothetical protein NXI18_21270 [Alphaproteobacteria bacterium]|nr:hypothetical protein [Alphaproteobacteria bacterium]